MSTKTEEKTVEQLAAETKADFDAKFDKVKEIAEEALGKAAAQEELTKGQKQEADERLTAMNETKAMLDEVMQKLARKDADGSEKTQTPGERFVGSDQFKAMNTGTITQGRVASVEMKTITSLTTDADGSAGDWIETQRVNSPMVNLPDRRLTIRDLLAPGQTSSNAIEYVQETGYTNNAGMTAEGALKPESTLKYDLATSPVRKIAHWMLASAEILADAPGLRSMIDQRLRYGLKFKEEEQLLNGDGTGQNLNGLIPQATAYSAAFAPASETAIDKIRLGMLQAALAEYPASGSVMHPTDWARIELTKDGDGNYIIGNPQGTLNPTLWSLPVVATQAIEIDKFLVGAFSMAAQVFDRMQSTVMVSTEDSDNFRKNLVTILAEERLALAVYRPEAFIYGDMGFVA